mgnify:CR=1 FL=1
MAFAIIETGGKQYKVAEGDALTVEKLKGYNAGDTVTFDKVLLVDDGTKTTIGTPYIEGKAIEVELVENGKGKKLYIQKFKSKSRYKRRLGHRQHQSKVSIRSV